MLPFAQEAASDIAWQPQLSSKARWLKFQASESQIWLRRGACKDTMLNCLTFFSSRRHVFELRMTKAGSYAENGHEMKTNATVPVWHRLHEFIQQLIVGLASNSLMPQPDVERVLQQRLQKHTKAETNEMTWGGNTLPWRGDFAYNVSSLLNA